MSEHTWFIQSLVWAFKILSDVFITSQCHKYTEYNIATLTQYNVITLIESQFFLSLRQWVSF